MGDHLTDEQIQEQYEAGDRLRDEVRDGDKTRYKIEWNSHFDMFHAYRWLGGDEWELVDGVSRTTLEECEDALRSQHRRQPPPVRRKELFL